MTVLNPPSWLQALATHTAQGERLALDGLIAGSGIAGVGQMTVTQRGAGANMSVDVAGGTCYIKGTQNTYQGTYSLTNDATVNLAVAAADPTLGRRDLVIARIQDAAYSGSINSATLEVVTGTPASSPVEPALPANSLKLAVLVVNAGATSITNANITASAASAASRLTTLPFVCTSTTRPTQGLVTGFTIYETDSNVLAVYESGAWKDIGPRSTGVITSGLVTASTGFSLASQAGILTGRVGQITATFTRTGSSISGSSSGNITNVQVATVTAGWRPAIGSVGWAAGASGPVTGGYLTSGGALTLASLMPNVALATSNQFTITVTFVQGN